MHWVSSVCLSFVCPVLARMRVFIQLRLYDVFLLLWPRSSPDDLEMWTRPRYSEDLRKMKFQGQGFQNSWHEQGLFLANLESLKDRRIKHSQSFFKKILSTNGCLHTLLPPERNNEVLSKLRVRKPLKYLVPYSRTKRYQSFVNYALAHFQNNK